MEEFKEITWFWIYVIIVDWIGGRWQGIFSVYYFQKYNLWGDKNFITEYVSLPYCNHQPSKYKADKIEASRDKRIDVNEYRYEKHNERKINLRFRTKAY